MITKLKFARWGSFKLKFLASFHYHLSSALPARDGMQQAQTQEDKGKGQQPENHEKVVLDPSFRFTSPDGLSNISALTSTSPSPRPRLSTSSDLLLS